MLAICFTHASLYKKANGSLQLENLPFFKDKLKQD